MHSIDTLATFFGSAVISFGVLLVGALFFGIFHEGVGKISAKLLGVTTEEAKATFVGAFQQYRRALVVLLFPTSP